MLWVVGWWVGGGGGVVGVFVVGGIVVDVCGCVVGYLGGVVYW